MISPCNSAAKLSPHFMSSEIYHISYNLFIFQTWWIFQENYLWNVKKRVVWYELLTFSRNVLLIGLLFYPEHGNSKFLRNVGQLQPIQEANILHSHLPYSLKPRALTFLGRFVRGSVVCSGFTSYKLHHSVLCFTKVTYTSTANIAVLRRRCAVKFLPL